VARYRHGFHIGTRRTSCDNAVRNDIFLRPKQETLTMRNNPSQTALPIRKWGSFPARQRRRRRRRTLERSNVALPSGRFRIRSHMIERYGEGIMPDDNHIQIGLSVTMNLSPITRSSNSRGHSGKAGNIKVRSRPAQSVRGCARERIPTRR